MILRAASVLGVSSTTTALVFVLLLLLLEGASVVAVQEWLSPRLRSVPVVSSGKPGPSTWAATLSCEEFRADNGKVAFYTRALCFDDGTRKECGMVGPTIEVFPGDNLTLTFVNRLGPNTRLEDDAPMPNTLRNPNTTNLHTHGMHMDPRTDTIFNAAQPGEQLTYNYAIVPNHAPGMHWYHAHVHGATALAVMGGIAGAIIVRPTPEQNVPESLAVGLEYVMVISTLIVDQEKDARGHVTQGCMAGSTCDVQAQPPGCTAENTADSTTFNFLREYTCVCYFFAHQFLNASRSH